jgi:hypothetical protein
LEKTREVKVRVAAKLLIKRATLQDSGWSEIGEKLLGGLP